MFKLKDKNGTILNVATKATYHSLLSTGNYKPYKETKPKENQSQENNKDNKSRK